MLPPKNNFNLGIFILISIILLGNVEGIVFINEGMLKLSGNEITFNDINIGYLIGVFFMEAILIYILIFRTYIAPVNELQKHIASFLSGQTKGTQIVVKTNYVNPNVRFVLKFFDYVLNSLKNIKDELLSGKAIKSEVQLATELQEKLLNKKLVMIPSLDVIAKSKPAGEIGGDSYDIIQEGDNYYLYVGDVTGHGVGAGFVMVMVNALISGFAKVFRSGAQILATTNEIIKPRVKSNILMTLLMLRWNEGENRLFMTGAGHEYLIVYKHAQNKCFLVKSGGLALGMTKNIHKILREQEIKFEMNDIAILYTDGITECINQTKKDGNEQMFGEQRLKSAIENAPSIPGSEVKTAQSVFNNITIEISKFMGYQHKQMDDITLLVAHFKGEENYSKAFPNTIDAQFITEWEW